MSKDSKQAGKVLNEVGPKLDGDQRGNGSKNGTIPLEQTRVRPVRELELDEGPNVGEFGEYLPATYKTGAKGRIIRQDR